MSTQVQFSLSKTHYEQPRLEEGKTLLHLAVERSDDRGLINLLHAGAKVNVTDEAGRTPLHLAVQKGDETAIAILLHADAHVDQLDNEGKTPLFYTINQGCFLEINIKALELLIEKDANVNHTLPSGDNEALLHFAAKVVDPEHQQKVIKLLIDAGADLNLQNAKGQGVLHLLGDSPKEVYSMLLENGADVNLANNDGEIPLHVAINQKNLDAIKILIQHKADVNLADKEGKTPLLIAIENASKQSDWDPLLPKEELHRKFVKSLKIIRMLLEAGADVNLPNKEGQTPLHIATASQNVDAVNLLIEHGADVNLTDNKRHPPLFYTITNFAHPIKLNLKTLESLIQAGADVNFQFSVSVKSTKYDFDTLLHYAIEISPYKDLAKVFRIFGDKIDLNLTNHSGQTILHKLTEQLTYLLNSDDHIYSSADESIYKTYALLYHLGADESIRDHQGKTPKDDLPEVCQSIIEKFKAETLKHG